MWKFWGYEMSFTRLTWSLGIEPTELLQTGTLTEDGLDMWGIVPVCDRKFQVPVKRVDKMDHRQEFLVGMVTCHSLTIINGKLSGDPLDLKVS
jgi:cation-transporting ATPase 13A3/4/5